MEFRKPKKGKIGSSRNLYRPDPKITILRSSNWSKTPKANRLLHRYRINRNGYVEVIENGFYIPLSIISNIDKTGIGK